MTSTPFFKRVCVLGLGYIGLPTAATLASRGVEVIGVDIRKEVVERLNAGKAHFSEPDLDSLLEAAVTIGKLSAVTQPVPADAFIISVPTPNLPDKSADLSSVESAALMIARVLKKGDLIVLESTSPVGTTERVCQRIAGARPDLRLPSPGVPGDIYVAYCPERILPGRMVFELVENDRIIGGMSNACSERAEMLYRIFVRGKLHRTPAPTAEFVKLIENAYRDTNIAFANELSILCARLNLNVWEAIELANRHPRVNILNPGPGVGGHCIAVDPWFLISAAPELTPLMRVARHVNDQKPEVVLAEIRHEMKRFSRPTVACLGLAYKPDVGDLRESPALHIACTLAEENVDLIVVEPNIECLPPALAGRSNVVMKDIQTACCEADIVVVLVGHDGFRTAQAARSPIVIDTVGIWKS